MRHPESRGSDGQPARGLLQPAAAGPHGEGLAGSRQRRAARPLAGRRARRLLPRGLRVARRLGPAHRAPRPWRHGGERKDRRAGHGHDRLHRRVRLGRDGGVAAAGQRGGHPAGEPGEPLRGADLLVGRGPVRAAALLPHRPAQLRAPAAGRSGPGGRPGEADAGAGREQGLRARRPEPLRRAAGGAGRRRRPQGGHRCGRPRQPSDRPRRRPPGGGRQGD